MNVLTFLVILNLHKFFKFIRKLCFFTRHNSIHYGRKYAVFIIHPLPKVLITVKFHHIPLHTPNQNTRLEPTHSNIRVISNSPEPQFILPLIMLLMRHRPRSKLPTKVQILHITQRRSLILTSLFQLPILNILDHFHVIFLI